MQHIPTLFKKHNITPRGAVVIGAHVGEEAATLISMGFTKILFVEPNLELSQRLVNNLNFAIQKTPGVRVEVAFLAIADANGMKLLHMTNNPQSNSLLPLKEHSQLYPEIVEQSTVLVGCRRLDSLLDEIGWSWDEVNYLHMDTQGSEGLILKGSEGWKNVEAISVEVNRVEMYEGCMLQPELDALLASAGFTCENSDATFGDSWGDAFYVRPAHGDPGDLAWQRTVSMSKLGSWGRFGNQIFQRMFLEVFAQKHRLKIETAPWVGRSVFGFDDPQPTKRRAACYETDEKCSHPELSRMLNAVDYGPVDLDIFGIYQYHTRFYRPYEERLRKLFAVTPDLKRALDERIAEVFGSEPFAAIHLRRGDYVKYAAEGSRMFNVPPIEWYVKWLDTLPPDMEIYIATDAQNIDEIIAPLTVQNRHLHWGGLGIDVPGCPEFVDWYMFTRCHMAAISNSTFAFTACMFNNWTHAFWRPDLDAGGLVEFDPWDSDPLLHREG